MFCSLSSQCICNTASVVPADIQVLLMLQNVAQWQVRVRVCVCVQLHLSHALPCFIVLIRTSIITSTYNGFGSCVAHDRIAVAVLSHVCRRISCLTHQGLFWSYANVQKASAVNLHFCGQENCGDRRMPSRAPHVLSAATHRLCTSPVCAACT
jgi:hypothetical protein